MPSLLAGLLPRLLCTLLPTPLLPCLVLPGLLASLSTLLLTRL